MPRNPNSVGIAALRWAAGRRQMVNMWAKACLHRSICRAIWRNACWNSRAAIEGERKQITVLFADIKGSTSLIQDLDPEQADQRLSPILQAMIDAVHRYEGTINRIEGDGIMALFGAPLAHEDTAVRAAYAALDMQNAVRNDFDAQSAIRVGLHAGEVVVRAIHTDLSVDYDAIGATVHLAARMEQMAEPGTIYCTSQVVRLAEGLIATRPLGAVPVKGFREPLELFEISATPRRAPVGK